MRIATVDGVAVPSDHAASPENRSGLSSARGTPVARSIDSTNSAGTPRLERVSQYQTCDCVVPMRFASGACPPASSQARRRALVDMSPTYQELGKNQPNSLCATDYLSFGSFLPMGKKKKPTRTPDPVAVGRRVRKRREALGLSQPQLAAITPYVQQGIGGIEKGTTKRLRYGSELAEALHTTERWLLWEEGPEVVGDPEAEARKELAAKLTDMPIGMVLEILGRLRSAA